MQKLKAIWQLLKCPKNYIWVYIDAKTSYDFAYTLVDWAKKENLGILTALKKEIDKPLNKS